MHIFFSGIGGSGIGPLALIAKQAGYEVSGSDKQHSDYISYLQKQGIDAIHIGQSKEAIQKLHSKHPIDWYVYSSAVAIENPNAPELTFCNENNIKSTKRDDLINFIIKDKKLKMIAIAGTHGKTTTTAMLIWLYKQMDIPISYSVGTKISYGAMGEYNPDSHFFIYEADEYDKNFLAFQPHTSIITGIDWDHPDIYPTRQQYQEAFKQFVAHSNHVVMWQEDAATLKLAQNKHHFVLDANDQQIQQIKLTGLVNRKNAWQVMHAIHELENVPTEKLLALINKFPGLSRRFEQIAPDIYSDYAHTTEKIRGALQTAREVAGDNFIVVYEGLHNTRQHFIKKDLAIIFSDVKKVYVVPSYLAREDPNLPLLTPKDIARIIAPSAPAEAALLNDQLKHTIEKHLRNGDKVLCLSAGGGGSLDEWLRQQFKKV